MKHIALISDRTCAESPEEFYAVIDSDTSPVVGSRIHEFPDCVGRYSQGVNFCTESCRGPLYQQIIQVESHTPARATSLGIERNL